MAFKVSSNDRTFYIVLYKEKILDGEWGRIREFRAVISYVYVE